MTETVEHKDQQSPSSSLRGSSLQDIAESVTVKRPSNEPRSMPAHEPISIETAIDSTTDPLAKSPTNLSAIDQNSPEWVPKPFARRSSFNYETDCVHLLGGNHLPGRVCCKHRDQRLDEMQKKFHTRRESFSREDQKHQLHEYLLQQNEDPGFTSN